MDGPKYFADVAKAIKSSAFDESKFVQIMSGAKVEAVQIAESLAAAEAPLMGEPGMAEAASAVEAALAAYAASMPAAYQVLADLRAVKAAAAEIADERAPPAGAAPAPAPPPSSSSSSSAAAAASAAPAGYGDLLKARTAKKRGKGTDLAEYKRDRGEVDQALKELSAAGDDDAVIASTAPGGGAGAAGARIVCQITRTLMTDPVRAEACGHVYERAAITQLLKGGKQVCPIQGCKKPLTVANLADDPDTRYRVEQELRRRADAGEDDGAAGAGGDGDDDED
jgi:hypothetical protein